MTTKDTNARGTHTPGPWTAYELGDEDGSWGKWSIVHNGPIAYGGDNGKGSENSRATAQLMAAAPELLAALAALVRDVQYLVDDGTLPISAIDHPSIVASRAAIAKARGV